MHILLEVLDTTSPVALNEVTVKTSETVESMGVFVQVLFTAAAYAKFEPIINAIRLYTAPICLSVALICICGNFWLIKKSFARIKKHNKSLNNQ